MWIKINELSIFWRFYSRRCIGAGICHLGDSLLSWLQDLEGTNQVLVDTHQGTGVVELSAVVRSRKYCNQLPLCEEFVSFLDHLMGSAYEIQVVLLAKYLNEVRTKGERNSSLVLSPALGVFVGIWPQKVAEQSCLTDYLPVSGTSVGFSIFLICSILSSSGDNPPCIQRIRSSMSAATGRQLKQSMKSFQSLMLYLLLPEWLDWYIHHRNHICGLWRSTRDFLWGGKNCEGIWSCRPLGGR